MATPNPPMGHILASVQATYTNGLTSLMTIIANVTTQVEGLVANVNGVKTQSNRQKKLINDLTRRIEALEEKAEPSTKGPDKPDRPRRRAAARRYANSSNATSSQEPGTT